MTVRFDRPLTAPAALSPLDALRLALPHVQACASMDAAHAAAARADGMHGTAAALDQQHQMRLAAVQVIEAAISKALGE